MRNKFMMLVGSIVLILMIFKAGMLWKMNDNSIEKFSKIPQSNHRVAQVQEGTVEWNFDSLSPKVKEQEEKMKLDIHSYIREESEKIERRMIHGLVCEDGFLDWLFGWETGYKILWHWTKGVFGSPDDAQRLVAEAFREHILEAGDEEAAARRIERYIWMRIEDYYRSVLALYAGEIRQRSERIEHEGKKIVAFSGLPWEKYLMQVGLDAGGAELVGGAAIVGINKLLMGKLAQAGAAKVMAAEVAGKAASKQAGTMVASKIATIGGSKVFLTAVTLGGAILVDYLFNKGYEILSRDKEERRFRQIIHSIVHEHYLTHYSEYADETIESVQRDIFSQLKSKAIIHWKRK